MMFKDIHSHTRRIGAVYNLSLDELRGSLPCADEKQELSVGLHPWYLSERWREDLVLLHQWAALPQVVMIGEAGFDRNRVATYQKEAFIAQALLAEEVEKPLIIHCVKAVDELLAVRKQLKPQQRWIFHGFRGKPQQAGQLLQAGICLSFGEYYNEDSLRLCPLDKFYVESDDSRLSFEEISLRIIAVRSSLK